MRSSLSLLDFHLHYSQFSLLSPSIHPVLSHLVVTQEGEVYQLGLKWHKCHCLKAQHALVKGVLEQEKRINLLYSFQQ